MQTTAYGTVSGDRVQSIFCRQGAVLVIVNDFSSQFRAQVGGTANEDSLFAGLPVYGTYADGTIYLCH